MDKALKDRFNRLRGQLDGLEKMLADGRDCVDIVTQISAVKAALSQLSLVILEDETNCLNMNKKQRDNFKLLLNRAIK
ncbi:MAG: metal-sensitive transcriptional regulator [Candidatus Komeilibacteria bacterium]|nr:metal-sensitive transcriptional regulator [Candidatus Komeilibacteria bacterium]